MAQQIPRSAAASIWSHLPAGTPNEVERRRTPDSVADAMWPSLAPQPQPKLQSNRWREADAAANTRAWGSGRDQTNK